MSQKRSILYLNGRYYRKFHLDYPASIARPMVSRLPKTNREMISCNFSPSPEPVTITINDQEYFIPQDRIKFDVTKTGRQLIRVVNIDQELFTRLSKIDNEPYVFYFKKKAGK